MIFKRMRHVGLFGGTFDPIHIGHLALAEEAQKTFALDEVRFLPCAQQALKETCPASAKDRCAMLRLAIASHATFTLDCRELFRKGKTYTYQTIMELKAEAPDIRFWFIMGMDSANSFPRWYQAEALSKSCEFIVFDRPGVEPPSHAFAATLLAHRLTGPLNPHSSTTIRSAVAKNQSIRYSMCDLEERYLRDHHLYL